MADALMVGVPFHTVTNPCNIHGRLYRDFIILVTDISQKIRLVSLKNVVKYDIR